MKTSHLIGLSSLFVMGLGACQENATGEMPPAVVQAAVEGDALSSARVDQATGVITVTPSGYDPKLRNKLLLLTLQTTPDAFLSGVDVESHEALFPSLGTTPRGLVIDVTRYDNRTPLRVWVRSREHGWDSQKQYRIQLQAEGPTQFVALPDRNDRVTVPLKSYQEYGVRLPVVNLYDGNPAGNRVLALREGSDAPLELGWAVPQFSRDLVEFYFNQKTALPGEYKIELRRADGQRAVAPTRIVVTTTE